MFPLVVGELSFSSVWPHSVARQKPSEFPSGCLGWDNPSGGFPIRTVTNYLQQIQVY